MGVQGSDLFASLFLLGKCKDGKISAFPGCEGCFFLKKCYNQLKRDASTR